MPIAYSSGTNIITVTGYSEATPCNFTDIYNADVSGSWGVVTRQCTNQFCVSAIILIGDGTTATWFADEQKMVLLSAAVGTSRGLIRVMASAHFRIGKIVDSAKKTTTNGCYLRSITTSTHPVVFGYYLNWNYGHNIEIYSSKIDALNTSTTGWQRTLGVYITNLKIYNSILNGILNTIDGATIQNLQTEGDDVLTVSIFEKIKGTLSLNKLDGHNLSRGFVTTSISTQDMTVSNVTLLNTTYVARCQDNAYDMYLINTEATWAFSWSNFTGKVYRQYEFDLKLIDITGSGISTTTVKIWDEDDAIVTNVTTNTSGVLATQTLTYGYYNQTGGNTPTMKTPHEMRIYKYGKEMLSSKSNIEAKTDWAFTMYTDDHITQTTEATVAAYTGITINHTTETITISENHTLDEIYDYCQYDMIAATKQLDQTMHTADGVNFVSEYSFVVNTGITVTATDQKLSMITGETYTLTGTAQFTGIIATTATTRIPVKLSNIVDGSRYWVGKESDGSKIFEGTQSGSGVATGYYEHTADTNIDVRVRKSSASVKYKPWIGEGTLIAEAFSLRIRQIQDGIIT